MSQPVEARPSQESHSQELIWHERINTGANVLQTSVNVATSLHSIFSNPQNVSPDSSVLSSSSQNVSSALSQERSDLEKRIHRMEWASCIRSVEQLASVGEQIRHRSVQLKEDRRFHLAMSRLNQEIIQQAREQNAEGEVSKVFPLLLVKHATELEYLNNTAQRHMSMGAIAAAISVYTDAESRIQIFIGILEKDIRKLTDKITQLKTKRKDFQLEEMALNKKICYLRREKDLKFKFIYNKGFANYLIWQYENAVKDFTEAIRLDNEQTQGVDLNVGSSNYNVFALRGTALILGKVTAVVNGQYLNAKDDFEKFLSLKKDPLIEGKLLFALGDFRKAIGVFDSIIQKTDPKEVNIIEELNELLAQAHFKSNNIDKAVDCYKRSLEMLKDKPSHFVKKESVFCKMGDIYFFQKKIQEALVFYKKANEINSCNPLMHVQEALNGNIEWQYKIGMFYLNNSIPKDYEKAFFWLLKVTKDARDFSLLTSEEKARRIDANYQVGLVYLKGNLQVEQSFTEALPYLRYVADNSVSPEQIVETAYEVGLLYKKGAEGIGVVEAIHQLKKVADAPNAPAEKRMNANIYLGSLWAIVKNFAEARAYSKKAVDAGRIEAQADFISATLQIAESSQDKNSVLSNYIEASDLGDAKASFRLGMIYKNGEGGVLVNLKEAKKYLLKAKEKNYPDAAEQLAALQQSSCAIS